MNPICTMSRLSTNNVLFSKIGSRPTSNFCHGFSCKPALKTLTDCKNRLKNPAFCSSGVWYRMCYTLRGHFSLDTFLNFRLVCRVTGCRRVRSSCENVRTKSQTTSPNHHESNSGDSAGPRPGGRSQFAGDQPVYPEHGLGRLLGTRYETDRTAHRCLRKGTHEVSPVGTATRVHVIRTNHIFSTSGRANRSVTFFCP